MTTLVWDIETDGFVDAMTVIHSLVIRDVETGDTLSCCDAGQPGPDGLDLHDVGYAPIQLGLKMLEDADMIVGHNIQEFDIPAVQKLYPNWKPKGIVRDTLIMSRLMYADMADADFRQEKRLGLNKWIPKFMFGLHSLESWGQRLGYWKGDYSAIRKAEGKLLGLEGDALTAHVWGSWNQSMQDYCEQDVEVNTHLWNKLNKRGFSEDSIQLEHDVRRIIRRQERHGFAVDERKIADLHGTLAQRKAELEKELHVAFPPWFRSSGVEHPKIDRSVSQKQFPPIGYEKDRKGNFKLDKEGNKKPIWVKCGWSTEAPFTKVKREPFNPGSRFDVADRLKKLFNWQPEEFTNDGHAKVDDEILAALPYPETKPLAEYFMVAKRIGQVAEGKEAWARHVKNGRIHGRVMTNGAVTGRMTHSKPNLAQVPSSRAPYGHECRSIFMASAGKLLVGIDADALELRDLAGYMAAYDGGAYIKTILEGRKEDGTDMHTINAKALGCSRDVAKTYFYAMIYGSGDYNLGRVLGVTGSKKKITTEGAASRKRLMIALPALGKLTEAVAAKAKGQGFLKGLDGRIVNTRSAHASLNTLLQSAGAIQMKRALVILDDKLQSLGFIPGSSYEFAANVHDEWQIEADESIAELVGKEGTEAIRLAGEHYKFKCPLAGNAVVGRTWADTH